MLQSLDTFTLSVGSILASSAFGTVFVALWLRRRSERHLLYWAGSSWLYAAIIVVLHWPIARQMAIAGPVFALMGVSDILIVAGVYKLDRGHAFARWMIIPVVSTALGRILPPLLRIDPGRPAADVIEAIGLAIGMGISGIALLRAERGKAGSRGRKIAGAALLAYLPGYLAIIVLRLGYPDAMAMMQRIPLLMDQMLLGVLNLGLLAIPAERAHERLRLAASLDPLTGAWNRDGLARFGPTLLRPGSAVIAIDIDYFKTINDRHGHSAGDQVLVALARNVKQLVEPQQGALFRLGGDEFVAIVPECGFADAERIADSLRHFKQEPGDLPHSTLSIGIALVGRTAPGIEEAIKSADAALYRAKALGRNRAALFAA